MYPIKLLQYDEWKIRDIEQFSYTQLIYRIL